MTDLYPGLYIVATPIGNLRDMTRRAIDTLQNADLILCEDTRDSGRLLSHFGIDTTLQSYHGHSDQNKRQEIITKLKDGAAIALISDAGTPLISDPGYRLVRHCHDHGINVIPVPGPSAPIAALSASGLPSDQFKFIGFLPSKQSARRKILSDHQQMDATLIAFEAPHRLTDSLSDIAEIFGDREMVVAREITKKFEEIRLSSVSDHLAYYGPQGDGIAKGEIVLLIAPANGAISADQQQIDDALKKALNKLSVKDASALIADIFDLSKRDCYQRALVIQDDK
jgi:16S rRNA (cytidine1402-2'-O)-methyltransferase